MTRRFLLFILLIGCCSGLLAQGNLEDYQRSKSLYRKYSGKVYCSDVEAHWIGNTHRFWYIRHQPDGDHYIVVDADKRTQKELRDKEKLDALLKNHQSSQPRNRGGYWGNRDWQRDGASVPSPDGTKEAFIRESNVFVREKGSEKQLSFDGSQGDYYSTYIQWSPDGTKLATMKIRPAEQRYMYFVESSPKNQLQPKLHKLEYTKPGDALPFQRPCIFDVEKGLSIAPSTALFSEQYDINRLRWNDDSQALTFEYNQRGHQVYRVLEVSAQSGEVRVLIDETSDTYVNYNRRFRHDLSNGTEIIWMSERDNWNHLYLYDRNNHSGQNGTVKHQITKGEWYVRTVLDVNEEQSYIEFTASGVNPEEDPYLIHYYRIQMDGSDMVCLTPEKGMHQAVFSYDRKYLVDVYSQTDVAPVAELRDASDGSLCMTLEKADISALEAEGWKAPETFVAKGRDGQTDIWGLIYRPSQFDPNKSYPVIEYIYSGPGDQYTPKSFSSYNWNATPLAELGFIVVIMDGMTTSFRSKAFEAVCYKNLKDAGLPDRIAWIKAAARQYPYMDTTRVGIFGASAGGQNALGAVLFHPEFYKAAYSACGCHDNRMDKIWWNEQWMGYPIGEQYATNSNVENAHLLTRPLMLVVGEIDNNVDPASTMQVVDALIKANKDFELVVLPSEGHTMGGSYGEHKRFDFFVKHLWGIDPPKWDQLNNH